MSDLENSFLQQIGRQPHDWLPRLIFADWLEEQGDPRGELIRLVHQLTRLDCEDLPRKEAWLEERFFNYGFLPSPSLPNSLDMKFVLIPPGEFRMGSPDSESDRRNDEAQVDVILTQGFWLGQYTVTQAEYEALMGQNPSFHDWDELERHIYWPNPYPDPSGHPVEQVSWEDAMEFCRKLTKRERAAGRLPAGWEYTLPTEAQWEYACRAGTTTRFSFPDEFEAQSMLNCQDSYPGNGYTYCEVPVTVTVGRGIPNYWFLFDMHGNVWEWCQDWYVNQLPGGTDPEVVKTATNRVRRGGSWNDLGRDCRSAVREASAPESRSDNLGFRVALVQCR